VQRKANAYMAGAAILFRLFLDPQGGLAVTINRAQIFEEGSSAFWFRFSGCLFRCGSRRLSHSINVLAAKHVRTEAAPFRRFTAHGLSAEILESDSRSGEPPSVRVDMMMIASDPQKRPLITQAKSASNRTARHQ
jgi:hypothetical protein